MYLKQLYQALLTSLVVSANAFAAGNMSPDLVGFFDDGGVGEIRKVRLANPNDTTFGACRLNFGGQIVEFGANGGEVTLTRPIGLGDQIPTYPDAPYLQSDDAMTVKFAQTVGITTKGQRFNRYSPITATASKQLNIHTIVVRLSQIFPTLEEISREDIQPVVEGSEKSVPQFNYSQIKHLVKTGTATECYPLNSTSFVKGNKLQNAFLTGCLELSFLHISFPTGCIMDVYNKVTDVSDIDVYDLDAHDKFTGFDTNLQLPKKPVASYKAVMDVPNNLSVHAGNYASRLVCNN